ncbi:MAG TPA: CapA family protein [Actinopolymorphaceae bacterium]
MTRSLRAATLLLGAVVLIASLVACAGKPGLTVRPAGGSSDPATAAPSPTRHSGTPSPTSTPAPRLRGFTLVATGDVLLHERLWAQARRDATGNAEMNFAPQLAAIRPVVAGADVAICHLETPLAPKGGPYSGYPTFSVPPEIVPALARTGYDACTTASNHTFDQGVDGIRRTLRALDAAGLAHAGSARTPAEAARPTLIEVKTPGGVVTVGLLSYTFGFNGIPYPNGDTWRANEIDEKRILADAAAIRAAGAEFVVVALHWGTEYSNEPNAEQRELAPRLIASPDIDLLLGHHAHVVQPMQYVDGEWIVYGMGNLMAAHRTPGERQSEGLLVRFTIREDPTRDAFVTTRAEFLPLLQTDVFPVGVIDVPRALAGGPAGTATKARLRLALERTTRVVQSMGAANHGLRMVRR